MLSINAQEKKYAVNTVAFYNVENLFDTVDDPKLIHGMKLEHLMERIDGQKKNIKLS